MHAGKQRTVRHIKRLFVDVVTVLPSVACCLWQNWHTDSHKWSRLQQIMLRKWLTKGNGDKNTVTWSDAEHLLQWKGFYWRTLEIREGWIWCFTSRWRYGAASDSQFAWMKKIMKSTNAACEIWKSKQKKGRKYGHLKAKDLFWFEDISHLFRAAIKSWYPSSWTNRAITSLAKGQLWQLDVTQLQLLSASASLAGREEGAYLWRDPSMISHLLGMRHYLLPACTKQLLICVSICLLVWDIWKVVIMRKSSENMCGPWPGV